MICHSIEIHNHLLSEQQECLYCEINNLEQDHALLREALEKYGKHESNCLAIQASIYDIEKEKQIHYEEHCSCGLLKALEGGE